MYTVFAMTDNITYSFTDRQYYHKWAVLTDPKDLTAHPKGYVKCNITVNEKGRKVKVHPETEGEDDIEGYGSSFNIE